MLDASNQASVLIRGQDDSLFLVPLSELLAQFRLPDEQQKGSDLGDTIVACLDSAPALIGLKNAILGVDMMEPDISASSPSSAKHKFAPSATESLCADSPRTGKHKYSSFTD